MPLTRPPTAPPPSSSSARRDRLVHQALQDLRAEMVKQVQMDYLVDRALKDRLDRLAAQVRPGRQVLPFR